ncbi:bifunctional Nas2 [Babesia duncani]|uniref:Bifunctional Nas2 n=1 Tax=Babesia duncani TaxID=323732 RepID=A0AAD9UM55_9APIC|nr:bifunctional Nas2 [Babesia duncani]KAK2194966.1 bifunctional Nas2 [Babesia duncani]
MEVLNHAEEIKALDKKRQEIVKEIETHMAFLNSDECKQVGLKGPLVDKEDFPRNDIDLYAVRTARNRVACLKTDYEALMVEIESLLHKLHGSLQKK